MALISGWAPCGRKDPCKNKAGGAQPEKGTCGDGSRERWVGAALLALTEEGARAKACRRPGKLGEARRQILLWSLQKGRGSADSF